eukprot:m.200281 g.200281  ORF g.200281 m.200281 type:complete len:156 (+) comp25202_c1_seq14:1138-1605(+)
MIPLASPPLSLLCTSLLLSPQLECFVHCVYSLVPWTVLTGRLSVAVVAAVVVASTPTSFAVVIAILWFGITTVVVPFSASVVVIPVAATTTTTTTATIVSPLGHKKRIEVTGASRPVNKSAVDPPNSHTADADSSSDEIDVAHQQTDCQHEILVA